MRRYATATKGLTADVYASLLRQCGNAGDLVQGKSIHEKIVSSGNGGDRFLANLLVEMYGKCGSLHEARQVFDTTRSRNVFSWTIMIAAYAQNGHYSAAIDLFNEMLEERKIKPSPVTFLWVIDACLSLKDATKCRAVHKLAVSFDLSGDLVAGNALVNMFGKMGCLEDARDVLERMPRKDVVSWTSMIGAYAQRGETRKAVAAYCRMLHEGVKPNAITFASLVRVEVQPRCLEAVFEEHVRESGLEFDGLVSTALVEMKIRCGSIEEARQLFENRSSKDVVAWSAVVSAHAQHGHPKLALEYYREMERAGVEPSHSTFLGALVACTSLEDLEEGEAIHARIRNTEGVDDSDLVLGTALVNMYGKCSRVDKARNLFDKMQQIDLVLWNTMIAAYAQHGQFKEVLLLYRTMALLGLEPDMCTYSCVLDACACAGEIAQGIKVHKRLGTSSNNFVASALMNLYTTAGRLEDARRIFESLPNPDALSWSSIVAAFARAGDACRALELYQLMGQSGSTPDAVTLLNLLSGCCHSGLLDQAQHFFLSMVNDYGILPTREHCACIVDIVARCGKLHEAEMFIAGMPFQTKVAWKALLASCRVHSDIDRGKRSGEALLKLGADSSPYILLSNIFIHAAQS